MPGRGPAPKPAGRRARRNADSLPATTLRHERCEQPELPEGVDWPERVRVWWRKWGQCPQVELFTIMDWEFLMDTALLKASVWSNGDFSKLPELRIREAKFFVTPEDRARGRIILAEADDADDGFGSPSAAAARERRANVRAVGSGGAS